MDTSLEEGCNVMKNYKSLKHWRWYCKYSIGVRFGLLYKIKDPAFQGLGLFILRQAWFIVVFAL
jgi:hypothetical protein